PAPRARAPGSRHGPPPGTTDEVGRRFPEAAGLPAGPSQRECRGGFATSWHRWRTRFPAVTTFPPVSCVAGGGRVRPFAPPTAVRNWPPPATWFEIPPCLPRCHCLSAGPSPAAERQFGRFRGDRLISAADPLSGARGLSRCPPSGRD